MSVEKESTPNYITWEDYRRQISYLESDIKNLRKAVKLILGILVDKKILGEQTAKTFSETETNPEIIRWFLEKFDEK